MTEAAFRRLERDNLLAALNRVNWEIRGADGAAKLLGLKPTTFLSRMDCLWLRRSEN
jgi:transcriptional regulator with GAF, ATPase, and Fis domain